MARLEILFSAPTGGDGTEVVGVVAHLGTMRQHARNERANGSPARRHCTLRREATAVRRIDRVDGGARTMRLCYSVA